MNACAELGCQRLKITGLESPIVDVGHGPYGPCMHVCMHVYTQQHIPLSHMPLHLQSHLDTCAWVPVLSWGIIVQHHF